MTDCAAQIRTLANEFQRRLHQIADELDAQSLETLAQKYLEIAQAEWAAIQMDPAEDC